MTNLIKIYDDLPHDIQYLIFQSEFNKEITNLPKNIEFLKINKKI